MTGSELQEPFDVFHEAYELSESRQQDNGATSSLPTYNRQNKSVWLVGDHSGQDEDTNNSTVPQMGHGAATRATLIDSLSPAFGGLGWSRPVMVCRGDLTPEPAD